MTAHPPLPLPPHLQPASKASSTAKSTNLSAVARGTSTTSRSSSQVRLPRARQNAQSPEYTSPKATATLIRRVLGPQSSVDATGSPRPIEDILPPLTSSNAVDLQLYAIIAIVVKDFVQIWYSKITPDHVFVEEVIHLIAHCSRAVEQRLRSINVEELVLDEIPALVEAHVLAYRTAHESCLHSTYQSAPSKAYHALNPHPALSPFPDINSPGPCQLQADNEFVYRQLLVHGALAVLLPTEDLQNTSLRTLVSDIIADLILGQGVCGKVCEGWFLHDTVIKIVGVIKSRLGPEAREQEIEHVTRSRLEKFGLLSSKDDRSPSHSSDRHQSRMSAIFWRALQYAYFSFIFARFVVVGLFRARAAPSRSHSSKAAPASPIAPKAPASSQLWPKLPSPTRRPILRYRLLALVSTLLDLSTRMPWLTGFLSLCNYAALAGLGRLGATDHLLDK